MLPSKIHFPSDNTTVILKEVKKEKGVYEYQDGYYFKGKILELTEGEIERMIKKRIIKIEKINKMENEISLLKNNDHRTDTDIEWIREFYEFLQGKIPEKISIGRGHKPEMSAKKAFSIIWYLQEHFPVLPDHINRCDNCGELFDSWSEGIYWETKAKHYCGGCDHLVPEHYDRGRR